MYRSFLLFPVLLTTQLIYSQRESVETLLADTSMAHASVSVCFLDATDGRIVYQYDSEKSLIPASVLKLITSSAALELLGPQYRFRTLLGYSGSLNRTTGKLTGDLIIKGGGDPALGSEYFSDHYSSLFKNWIVAVKDLGIKKIEGRVLVDDSRYDYQPVPPKWLWEDLGNYYGAGVYGLSVFDNTFRIHFRTLSEGTLPEIISITPASCKYELSNWLIASGDKDNGYVFSAPYGNSGWLGGSIPANREDFVLRASIPDPPLFLAKVLNNMLDSAGIKISGQPTTSRLLKMPYEKEPVLISEVLSPPLEEIIEVLNHESMNLYAEHLLKEMGKVFKDSGSTAAGLEVLNQYLNDTGIGTDGIYLTDGSGVSPLDAISSGKMAELLFHLKYNGKYFSEFYRSLPDAGKEGTLKSAFTDPVFDSKLRAKSGSMTRVRSYAGYLKAKTGRDLVFCIIINNFSGPSQAIVEGIEEILKEAIIKN
ncbi:MAG: D-alanyl-D-alanine carboxypeptidase/D-alanyl-D-alanine-endopeptidase [Bacteroidota bacterium]|nr:D-alanyl-D-alanine carboxypeptidase/D-alanyl-D-alanine-endopeptidase [Bacteroidota bacterium]